MATIDLEQLRGTSHDKVRTLLNDVLTRTPADEQAARNLSMLHMLNDAGVIASFVPDTPAEADAMLLKVASLCLLLRSDDATPVVQLTAIDGAPDELPAA